MSQAPTQPVIPRLVELIAWAETADWEDGPAWHQGSWASIPREHTIEISDPNLHYERALVPKEVNLCGTSFCMAGKAVVDAGLVMLWDGGSIETCGRLMSDGSVIEQRPIYQHAQELLGLDEDEADIFFAGSNTIDTLKEMANAIALTHSEAMPYPGHGIWGDETGHRDE